MEAGSIWSVPPPQREPCPHERAQWGGTPVVWGARLSKAIAAVAVAGAMILLGNATTAANSAVQGRVVHDDPADFTPNVLDGHVTAITTVGDKVIVGGTFTMVREVGNPTTFDRDDIFAFDKDTGAIDPGFAPVVDGEVWTLDAAGDGTSVFVGGAFATVNGASNYGIAKLDGATGSMVPGFTASTAGKVRDLVYRDGNVYLGGDIWSVNGVPRTRMAVIDAVTGAVDPSFTVATTLPRVSVDWASKVDVSPDGSSMGGGRGHRGWARPVPPVAR